MIWIYESILGPSAGRNINFTLLFKSFIEGSCPGALSKVKTLKSKLSSFSFCNIFQKRNKNWTILQTTALSPKPFYLVSKLLRGIDCYCFLMHLDLLYNKLASILICIQLWHCFQLEVLIYLWVLCNLVLLPLFLPEKFFLAFYLE